MSYSEKPKVSWGAIVVVLAVMTFCLHRCRSIGHSKTPQSNK